MDLTLFLVKGYFTDVNTNDLSICCFCSTGHLQTNSSSLGQILSSQVTPHFLPIKLKTRFIGFFNFMLPRCRRGEREVNILFSYQNETILI